MINLCGKSVVKHLSIIFKNCIDTGTFSDVWKRSNIISVDNQIVDNYNLVSFSHIFGKILEKLLFNSTTNFLEENNLLNSNQSGLHIVKLSYSYRPIQAYHRTLYSLLLL